MMFYQLLYGCYVSFKTSVACMTVIYLKFTTSSTWSSNVKLVQSPNNMHPQTCTSTLIAWMCVSGGFSQSQSHLWNALLPINLNLNSNQKSGEIVFMELHMYFLQNSDSNNFCTYHFCVPACDPTALARIQFCMKIHITEVLIYYTCMHAYTCE